MKIILQIIRLKINQNGMRKFRVINNFTSKNEDCDHYSNTKKDKQ